MAFFEQLGKRITDASQGVAQQTKNFADITRLNNSISEKEKRITQLYLTIGKNYYERHKEDLSSQEQQSIDQINVLSAEIAQCREEIKQIKGVTKCTVCGAEIPVNAAFCNACGAKVVPTEAASAVTNADAKICPSCGAKVGKENGFCTNCGTKL